MEMLPHGLERDAEPAPRRGEPWVRRAVVAALACVVAAALLGLAGQQHETRQAEGAAATLTVKAPARLRGGIFFQGRIDIVARDEISRPRIVLGEGWTEEMQLNTLEPAPASETSSAGELELEYDSLRSDEHLTIWMQFEANPTAAGRRERRVALHDGDRLLAETPGTVTVLP